MPSPLSPTAFLFVACLALPGAAGASDLSLAFVGDFLPGAAAEATIAREGFDYLFDGVRPIVDRTGGLVLNLETPLAWSGTPVEGKTFTFLCSPAAATAMARARVAAATLANNHLLDQGVEAMRETLRALAEAGIPHAGAGEDLAAAAAPAQVGLPEGKVAVLSFSNTFPEGFWAGAKKPGTAFGDLGLVVASVRKAREAGPVVVCFHWGEELMESPKPYQVELARAAIDAGASLVIGHHPHVLQPLEIYRGRPIFYSLGNFSFGSTSRKSRHGLLVSWTSSPAGEWKMLELHPLLVQNPEAAFRPVPLEGEEAKAVFARVTSGVAASGARISWEGGRGILLPPGPLAPEPPPAPKAAPMTEPLP